MPFPNAARVKRFLGPEVLRFFYAAMALGLALFFIELIFAATLQGFLGAMGLLAASDLRLPGWYPRGLGENAAILVVFGAARAAVLLYRQYAQSIVANAFGRLQRVRIAETCFERPQTATLTKASALFSDIIIRGGLGLNNALGLVVNGVSAIFLFGASLYIAPKETVLGCAILAALLLPLKRFGKRVDDAGVGLSEEWQSLTELLVNGIRHNFFLRVLGRLDEERDAVDRGARAYLQHYKRYAMVSAQKANIPLFLGVLVIAVVSYVSLRSFGTPAALLLSFFYLFMRMAQYIGIALSSSANLQVQRAALSELYDWWEAAEAAHPPVIEPLHEAGINELIGSVSNDGIRIEATGISFRYASDAPLALNEVDFTLNCGDVLVATGESGSGKSTLLALLLGVYAPTTGSVRANGFDMNRAKLVLYPMIGYAGPDPYLIPGTVRDVLRYGHPDPDSLSDEAMRAALCDAQALEFVEALPDGLDTLFHESAQISTGQRQRLAIARVFARNPKLLILDEFTANLDGETEAALIASLRPRLERATTVIATHRPALRALATRTIHLG